MARFRKMEYTTLFGVIICFKTYFMIRDFDASDGSNTKSNSINRNYNSDCGINAGMAILITTVIVIAIENHNVNALIKINRGSVMATSNIYFGDENDTNEMHFTDNWLQRW